MSAQVIDLAEWRARRPAKAVADESASRGVVVRMDDYRSSRAPDGLASCDELSRSVWTDIRLAAAGAPVG